jgi:hypothetical protein
MYLRQKKYIFKNKLQYVERHKPQSEMLVVNERIVTKTLKFATTLATPPCTFVSEFTE